MTKSTPLQNQRIKPLKKTNEIRCPKCGKKAAEAKGNDVILEILCKCKYKYTYDNGVYYKSVRSA